MSPPPSIRPSEPPCSGRHADAAPGARIRALRLPLALLVLLTGFLAAAGPVEAQDRTPFTIQTHEIQGRIHQVWPLRRGACAHAAQDLLILSSVGTPPALEKRLTWMPCGAALVPGDPRIVERALPPETGVVDVALLPGRSGPQLVLASGEGLRVEALASDDPPRVFPVPGGLALPERPWDVSRIPLVDDWHDLGPPVALVPALRGGWLVDLTTGATRALPMPMQATYRTYMPDLPEIEWQWMTQRVSWPSISRADDDGDGRLDLFALGRFEIFVYHAGPEGLPAEPSRRIPFQPFDEETEREPGATATNYFARDIDGDTRADLMLSTISGGLSDGQSLTRIFLNPGEGVAISDPPSAERLIEDGYSTFTFVDADGDGVDEILEASIEFGVLQIVRFLLTRSATTKIRVLRLDPEAPGGLRVLFEDDFAFKIDFAEGAIAGVIPNLGDWNGDGIKDFYLADGDEAITFRMGRVVEGTLVFGSTVDRQPIPLASGQSRAADLDGDGLDEIITFTTQDPDAPLMILENLGRLPGTRASMSPAPKTR
ncbi:MAG: VCBS repeat-containing protein [bacterium]|nr:VCBS repeat-containing protein [bacterium]